MRQLRQTRRNYCAYLCADGGALCAERAARQPIRSRPVPSRPIAGRASLLYLKPEHLNSGPSVDHLCDMMCPYVRVATLTSGSANSNFKTNGALCAAECVARRQLHCA